MIDTPNLRGLNNAVSFLGEKLASEINIDPIAGKGLIRLAIKDDLGESHDINIQKLRNVIQNGLKKRLERIDIENVNLIIKKLDNLVVTNQSIFTIGNF